MQLPTDSQVPADSATSAGNARTDGGHSPIAIIGMAMRLPGKVNTAEEFWDMLLHQKTGHGAVPASRYNVENYYSPTPRRGSVYTKTGHFLDCNLASFDAAFFSLSKTEVAQMDPQQRLLCEVVWECFENAGQRGWRGKDIGCYVGVFGEDWQEISRKDAQDVGSYHVIGTGDYAISNRISFEYDLKGPSMTIQTACSSSLTGLHEACQALRHGDCSGAIVAGTNLILTPTTTVGMCEVGVLSADGKCKTFDASADGYGRGEAINAIFIKKLDDAVRDGDPIRAVIRSTAANSDGRTPNITYPNGDAQERLIRKAYQSAGIDDISQTGFFECHGTGTVVGDRVETGAIAKAFDGRGVIMGSVKSNVGHSEGASGLTSLIKVVLALEHQTIPPNPHFDTPNPKIPFNEAHLHVPTEPMPWPKDRSLRASVNSFGIGGSNAHAIVESARCSGPDPVATESDCKVIAYSANSKESLQRSVEAHRKYLEEKPDSLCDLAHTRSVHREQLKHRAYTLIGPNGYQQASQLVKSSSRESTLTFVFTGQGAQWSGMGRDLMALDAFRNAIAIMSQAMKEVDHPVSWSLVDMITADLTADAMEAPQLSQPLCTALQVGLVDVLRAWHICPDALVGHSSGEIAAAYAAGALSAQEAIKIAFYRGHVSKSLSSEGAMAAVGLHRDLVAPYLVEGVTIACENSPQSVTLSGDSNILDSVLANIRANWPDTLCRRLRVKVAYHSHHMRKVGEEYERLLTFLNQQQQSTTFYSSVSGDRSVHDLGAEYWRRNMESPVLFYPALQSILKQQSDQVNGIFLEIGPHAALAGPLKQIFHAEEARNTTYLSTVRRDSNSVQKMFEAAGELYLRGVPVDFLQVNGPGRVLNDLPLYPWHYGSTQHWHESRLSRSWRNPQFPHHELLGSRIAESGDLALTWRNVLSLGDVPWLQDHKLFQDIVFPGTGYIAIVGEAMRQISGTRDFAIRRLLIKKPMVLKHETNREIVTTFNIVPLTDMQDSTCYSFTVSSFDGSSWVKHCSGQARAGSGAIDVPQRRPHNREVSSNKWYQALRAQGLEYGPSFLGLDGIKADPVSKAASAAIPYPEELYQDQPYPLHPTLADCALQLFSVGGCHGLTRKIKRLVVPIAIESIYISEAHSDIALELSCEERENKRLTGDVVGMIDGAVVFAFQGCLLAPLHVDTDAEAIESLNLSRLEWTPRLEDMSANELIHRQDSKDSDPLLKERVGVLCMAETMHRIASRNLQPKAPHLQTYVQWLEDQVQSMREGSYAMIDQAREWATLDSSSRKCLIDQHMAYAARVGKGSLCTMAVRVCENIQELCEGTITPLDLLYRDNGLKQFYDAMDPLDYSRLFSILSHTKPTLRVLEIGAGTGATTAAALDGLTSPTGPRRYSQYCYTDISAGFFPAARERFKYHHGIDFAVLDIAKDPVEQGFEPHAFDLIIAANVLHATPKLDTTLQHVRGLLAAGGKLLLAELCPPSRFINYIMGILPGWWIGEEDGRKDEPYISPQKWDVKLRENGFTGTDMVVHDQEPPFYAAAAMVSTAQRDIASSKEVVFLSHSPKSEQVQSVHEYFTQQGYTVSFCSLHDVPLPDKDVISLLDLDGPFFNDISEHDWNGLQQFVANCKSTGILWVTHSAQIGCVDPAYSLVLGVARTIRSELSVDFATIEVEASNPEEWTALESIYRGFEDRDKSDSSNTDYEFAQHDGKIHTPRFKQTTMNELLQSEKQGGDATRLRIENFGRLDSLAWASVTQPQQLQDDQVEIMVHNAGLNFKDVLCATGMLDAKKDALGLEGSGVVSRVGPQSHLQPGKRVMFMGSGSFATRTVTSSLLCTAIPDNLAFEDAATMPCVYATAIYALMTVGRLEQDQTVLIHSACGGVGLAAIMISQMIGANIYTTVGNETKERYLQDHFGIPRQQIFNSRNDSFYQDIMRETNGRGVDLVLNSLSGELLHASWNCVARFGKMVEIGKRDLIGNGNLSLAPFSRNQSFVSVDLAEILQYQPRQCQRLLEECIEYFVQGAIKPIHPIRIFPATEIQQAFRYMQAGQHMGKIVVALPERLSSTMKTPAPACFSPNRSYLLVGGLGGIGRAVSQWMVEKGARKLVYLSRSAGSPSVACQTTFRELEMQGCELTVVQGDVANLQDVQRAIQKCTAPIAGVLQLSMVLEDHSFFSMSHAEWVKPLSPKVQGSWTLHTALMDEPLDFFVCFSSISGLAGQPGQANYAAGNTFIDAFVQYRQSLGLAASVIDLGVVDEIGYVAESGRLLDRNMVGITRLQEKDVMQCIRLACNGHSRITAGLAPAAGTPLACRSGFLQRDIRMRILHNAQEAPHTQGTGDNALKAFLAAAARDPTMLDQQVNMDLVRDELGRKIVSFLFQPEDEIDTTKPLADMGIDSLVVIEIRNWWCQTLGLEISVMEFMNAGNIDRLAQLAIGGLKAKYALKD